MKKFWLILILISLFLALPISYPIWQYTPLPKLVQFPWRFLSLTVFAVAVLSRHLSKRIAFLLAIITIIISIPFLEVTKTFYPEGFYTTNDDSTTVKNEYMPRWVKIDPTNRPAERQTVYFPGVKVIIDGREIEPQYDGNGIITTKGEIVFRETPLRLFADLISLTGIIFIIILLIL